MKIVIVGGVAGGATAAARLRRLDEHAEIIMFERGRHVSFANCGLPYYIGGVITDRQRLLVQTPERLKARFNIDVRVRSEVVDIDRRKKQVTVLDHASGQTCHETYDKLILSPGARPIKPPVPGVDSQKVFTLRNVPDADAIDAFIKQHKPRKAVVVGAGYIGLELAENLANRGLKVAVVEMLDQVMPAMDREMTAFIERTICKHGVALWLNDGVSAFHEDGDVLRVVLNSATELACDMAVLAVGVTPEAELAHKAGLEIGTTGAIKVNDYLQTSDPDIYAIGDAIEVKDFVLGTPTVVPLAGPANKQGRIAADNICGRKVTYNGTQGTAVLKVFDLTVAMTGPSEKRLKQHGLDYEKLYIHPPNHATYHPGAARMHIKLLFSKPQGRVLGAQIVGGDGVDKRIDVFATAIRAGMTVFDLQQLELAYAPPYGNAKDPVNLAGFAAGNILDGTVDVAHFEQLNPEDFVIDARTPSEFERGNVPGSSNMFVDNIRDNLDTLPKDKPINAYCTVGFRSYIACRILSQKGFAVRNLSGGYTTYQAITKSGFDAAEKQKQQFLQA